jgi:hypothetical protein
MWLETMNWRGQTGNGVVSSSLLLRTCFNGHSQLIVRVYRGLDLDSAPFPAGIFLDRVPIWTLGKILVVAALLLALFPFGHGLVVRQQFATLDWFGKHAAAVAFLFLPYNKPPQLARRVQLRPARNKPMLGPT